MFGLLLCAEDLEVICFRTLVARDVILGEVPQVTGLTKRLYRA